MTKLIGLLMVALAASTVLSPLAVLADAVSPAIRDTGKVYSEDNPDVTYYGDGTGGRANEASTLRFAVERLLQDGRADEAVIKAKKAAQLDPTDPDTHLLLARALSKKFYTKKGPVDEKLLAECLYEWNLIWHHDADQFDQVEAKGESRRLVRIARSLAKQHKAEALARKDADDDRSKERNEARAQIAAKPAAANSGSVAGAAVKTAVPAAAASVPAGRNGQAVPQAATGGQPATAASTSNAADATTSPADTTDGADTAHHKKHFLLF